MPSDDTFDEAQRAGLDCLVAAQSFLLTGHERPDGDCVGAQAALSRVLAALGKRVVVLNPDPVEPQYDYLARHVDFGVYRGGPVPAHDVAVLLDCSELSRCGALAPALAAADSRKVVVDHHIHREACWWDAAILDETAAATGLIVDRIARALGVELDEVARLGVFTSLVTDTGWFKYGNTDAETLAVASRLVRDGLQPAEVFGAIYQRRPADHPLFVADALARTEYHAGGRLALLPIPLAPGGRAGDLDTDDVLDLVRSVQRVEVVALLRERANGACKLSARSKGAYDVRELAATFGGGGHAKASGATLEGPLEAARARLLDAAIAGFPDEADIAG